MFENLDAMPEEALVTLMKRFKADTRPNKIDLGIGVYRNDAGETPIFEAVKTAEKRHVDQQTTKTYVGVGGNDRFNQLILDMVFGDAPVKARARSAQTPGGSGALRVLFETVKMVAPGATLWLPVPTWSNHAMIAEGAGLSQASYRYYDKANHAIDFAAMMEDLAEAAPGDALLLHGCCHNPTGADLDDRQWGEIARLCVDKNLLPLVDIAYAGFAEGMDADLRPLRELAERVPELLLAFSCSKNFGIYRDRVGAAIMVTAQENIERATERMLLNARRNYSMPPDHGGAIVVGVLDDPTLNQKWQDELAAIRGQLAAKRAALADALNARSHNNAYAYLKEEKGMFSLIGLSPEAVDKLREEHAIYMMRSGRINIAGMRTEDIPFVADKIIEAAQS